MLEAVLWLGVAWIVLLILPFRTLAKHLGRGLEPTEAAIAIAGADYPPHAPALAREVRWAVRRAADNVPFPALCLQQALAATCMLRRRGVKSALHLGVELGNGRTSGMRAHAWVDAAGVAVTGYPIGAEYTEVACFL